MSIIIIDIDIHESRDYFCISGSFDLVLKNTRLINNLTRLDAIQVQKAFYVPFIEELKISTLQKIQKIFDKQNFEYELSPKLIKELEHFVREEESFSKFSKNAATIRNNTFEDNDEISDKLLVFKKIYKQKLKPEFRELFPIQELSAFHMAFSQNSCNFAVPGAGKTSIVYGAYAYLSNLPKDDSKYVNNLLVIGPLSSFQPWIDEYKECFGREPNWFALSGNANLTKTEKTDYLLSSTPDELTLIFHGGVDTYQAEILMFLKNHKTMVVVDEAHRIKSPDNTWGRSVTKISENAVARVILTGTPTPNGYQDIYNLYKFIYPFKYREIIEFSYQDLKDLTLDPDIEDLDLDRLKSNLEPFFIRIKKKDLEKHMDLPKIIEHPLIRIEMDPVQREIYDFIFDGYISSFRENSSATLSDIFNRARLIRLRQAASNPSLLLKSLEDCLERFDEDSDINSRFIVEGENLLNDSDIVEKIEMFESELIPRKFSTVGNLILDEIFPRSEKVIIWTIFIQNSKELQDYLKDLGIDSRLLIGEVSLEDRVSIIKKFNNPDNMDFQVVIANPFSVSESISLHKGCRNAIYMERDYNCAMFLQSRDRIHRVGLKKHQKPNYYYLISADSIDEVIDERLVTKIRRMERLINDDIPLFGRLEDNDDTEIIEGLIDQYLKSENDKRTPKIQ